MSEDPARGNFTLLLVPDCDVERLTRNGIAMAYVQTAEALDACGPYDVIAEVTDGHLRMSRLLYDQIEVVDPA